MPKPLPNGANGRTSDGRFAKGNPGGPGNPNAKHTAELRAALFEAVTPRELKAIVSALVKKAKRSDVAAAREILDRIFGKATAVVEQIGKDEAIGPGVVICLPDNGRAPVR